MRFEQLKKDPNNILRKKLHKSKKGWVVAIALSLSGSAFLFGNTDIVKADDSTQVNNIETQSDQTGVDQSDQVQSMENNQKQQNSSDGSVKQAAESTEIDQTSMTTEESQTDTDTSTTKQVTSGPLNTVPETTTDYPHTVVGSNVVDNGDGTYTGDVSWDGNNYSITGKSGQYVNATDKTGDSIYIQVVSTESVKFTGFPFLTLGAPSSLQYGLYNQYGQSVAVKDIFYGDSSRVTDMELKDENGDVYYRVSGDAWIKQGTGISLSSDAELNEDTRQTNIFYRIFKEIPGEDSDDTVITKDVDTNENTVSGIITYHSNYYGKDYEYKYTGKPGETVEAKLITDAGTDILPKVSAKITSKSTETFIKGTSVTLSGDSSKTYDLYDSDFDYSGRGLSGGSTYDISDSVLVNGIDTYYYVTSYGINEWIKQEDGVNLNGEAGTITTAYDVKAIIEPLVVADVTIGSNLGDRVVKEVYGMVGTDVPISVPKVSGYTADKETVMGHVNSDNTITTTETVNYTKSPTSGGSSASDNNLNLNDKIQTLATFANGQNVVLYKLSGNKFEKVEYRALAPNTDWFSDKVASFNDGNVKYYRVATNEWVRSTDVYLYKEYQTVVNTKDSVTRLLNDEASLVTNRALSPRTSWLVDRIGYLGSSEAPYYRVATNEFVSEDDVLDN